MAKMVQGRDRDRVIRAMRRGTGIHMLQQMPAMQARRQPLYRMFRRWGYTHQQALDRIEAQQRMDESLRSLYGSAVRLSKAFRDAGRAIGRAFVAGIMPALHRMQQGPAPQVHVQHTMQGASGAMDGWIGAVRSVPPDSGSMRSSLPIMQHTSLPDQGGSLVVPWHQHDPKPLPPIPYGTYGSREGGMQDWVKGAIERLQQDQGDQDE